MFYNWTLFYRSPILSGGPGSHFESDWFLSRMKLSLDNGIIDYFAKTEEERKLPITENNLEKRMEVMQQKYPTFPSRFTEGIDLATNQGAFYFFVPIMINFILSINEMLREKSKKLRLGTHLRAQSCCSWHSSSSSAALGISVMGMGNSSYLLSWVIHAIMINAATSLISVFFGRAIGFLIFTRTPWVILFTLLFSFAMSITAIGFFITSLA